MAHILLSAFYCSPSRGGEAAVGWRVALGLARANRVTVLCGDLDGGGSVLDDLERYQATTDLPEGLTFRYIRPNALVRLLEFLHRLPGCWFLYYCGYRLWQVQAFKAARAAHGTDPFDIAHQLTIITCREPGYLWRLGIPWFWGPISGAASIPWKFIPSLGLRGGYRHATRNLLSVVQTSLSLRCRHAAKCAGKIWTVTAEDKRLVEKYWSGEADLMLETGALQRQGMVPKRLVEDEDLKLAWCGLIEARKALGLLMMALSGLGRSGKGWHLHVIGSGPEFAREKARAEALGLAGRITWHGQVSHQEAQALISACHVLVHTSLKEGTPHVVLEALSFGLPVICHNACGMGVAVDEICGITIPLENPELSIRKFTEAIERIGAEPDLYERLAMGALKRAGELTWEANIEHFLTAYQQALHPNMAKSDK